MFNENLALAEGIQASMCTAVLHHINDGRNEWALKHLNDLIDRLLRE